MRKVVNSLTLVIFLAVTLLTPLGAMAAASSSDAIAQSVEWLRANQAVDGSWGLSIQEKSIATPTILETLKKYGYLPDNYTIGVDWLQANSPQTNTFLARYLSVPEIAATGRISELISAQTSYGGWGASAGSSCDNATTALALHVLLKNGGYDVETSRAAYYLLANQNKDGSWGLVKGEPGSIYITGMARALLLEFQEKVRCDMSIELSKAAQWLDGKKAADGSWGAVELTCMAYKGLAKDMWGAAQNVPAYLLSQQLPNGSWDNDPYLTGLALEVLSQDAAESNAQVQGIRLLLDGKETNSFAANTRFEIVPAYVGHGVQPEVNLINPVGERTGITADMPLGRFYWNTEMNRCGNYQVEVNLKDGSGQVKASLTKSFTVEPYMEVSEAYVEVTPGASLVSKPVSPQTRVYAKCETNIFEPVNIIRKVYDAGKNEVDSKEVSAVLKQGENDIDTGSFTADTAAVTTYEIQANINYQGKMYAAGNASFKVLDKINSLYTTDADFDRGAMRGVNHDEVADQLQLNKSAAVFKYIWIANDGEGTVSKIDTTTGREVARYRTGPNAGTSPSRTCVDKDGNCWVGNRLNGTVIKIAMNGGVDKNNNGKIDTSSDINGNGRIDSNEILPWGQDEAILAVVPVGSGSNSFPRSMAIDGQGRIWVGLYNDCKYVLIDPVTCKPNGIQVTGITNPYGACVDSNGILWSNGRTDNPRIDKIDTKSCKLLAKYNVGTDMYGIVVDKNGIVWAPSYGSNVLVRFDPSTEKYTYHSGNGVQGRGVAVDNDGNIWVAYSGNNWVSKFDPSGKYLLSVNIGARGCSVPIGVGVDCDGYIWVSNNGTSNTCKIDTKGNIIGIYPTGANPYTYSDMTGFNLQNITAHEGTWTVTHDGGSIDYNWSKIIWHSIVPQNTGVTVRARAANKTEDLAGAAYVDISNEQPITNLKGRFIQVEVKLNTSDTSTPAVQDVEIIGINVIPVADAGADKDIKLSKGDIAKVTLDGTKSYDPNGNKLTYKWTWNGKSAVGPRPSIMLPLGTTEITLVVNNGISDSLPDKVNITVTDANGISSAPAIPANVNAAVKSTEVSLTWDAVVGATGYEIEVDGTVEDTQGALKYQHKGLLPESQHTYRVRAKNSAGASDWSGALAINTISAAAEINQVLTGLESGANQSNMLRLAVSQVSEDAAPGLDTLDAIEDMQKALNYVEGLMPLVPDGEEKASLQARIDALQERMDMARVTRKVEVAESLSQDLSLAEPIQVVVSSLQMQINALPDSELKEALQEKTNTIKEDVNEAQAVTKVEILESLTVDVSTQELVDAAQQYLNEVQQALNTLLPEGETRALLQARIDAAQLAINIGQAVLKVKAAEAACVELNNWDVIAKAQGAHDEALNLVNALAACEQKGILAERLDGVQLAVDTAGAKITVETVEKTIVQADVDTAQQYIGKLPGGEVKSAFQQRLDLVQKVIDATTQTGTGEGMLKELESALLNADLTSGEQVAGLQQLFDTTKLECDKAGELLAALPDTDKEALSNRIGELDQRTIAVPGLLNAIQTILTEARDDYRTGNGNEEMRIKVQKGSVTDLLTMFRNEIGSKLQSFDELRWLSINKELAVVDAAGNMTAIGNGVVKITVYNEKGVVNIYMVVSMGNDKGTGQETPVPPTGKGSK